MMTDRGLIPCNGDMTINVPSNAMIGKKNAAQSHELSGSGV
jgi:hypothetical protein